MHVVITIRDKSSPFEATVQQSLCMCSKVPHQLVMAGLLQRYPSLVLCEIEQLVLHDFSTTDVGYHDLWPQQTG